MSQTPDPSRHEPPESRPADAPSRPAAPGAQHRLAQLTHLLTSRTRQRKVFGPPVVSLILAVALWLDQALGPEIPMLVAGLLALVLGLWAGWRGWQLYQRDALGSTWRMMLVASGGLLAFEALLIVLGTDLLLPFALLLGLFSLGEIAARISLGD